MFVVLACSPLGHFEVLGVGVEDVVEFTEVGPGQVGRDMSNRARLPDPSDLVPGLRGGPGIALGRAAAISCRRLAGDIDCACSAYLDSTRPSGCRPAVSASHVAGQAESPG